MNNELLAIVNEQIKTKIVRSHFTNFLVINSTTFLFVSSFFKEEKLLVSLDSVKPYINFITLKETPLTINNGLSKMARHYIKDGYLVNVEQLNNDNVLKFTIRQNRDNQYFDYYLYIELINKNTNFIITDINNRILLATKYSSKEGKRKILINEIYKPLTNNITQTKNVDYESYSKSAKKIYETALKKRIKEKYIELIHFIESKIRTLTKKEFVLKEEIKIGESLLSLKVFGDYCLYMEEDELLPLLKEENIKYDQTLSLKQLSSYFYKQYKRGKAKIEHANEQINICLEQLKYYNYLAECIPHMSEEELDSLSFDLLNKKMEIRKNDKIKNAKNPYSIKILGTEFLFGKNKEQNQNLTFHLAHHKNTFMHIHNYPGSHIVIKNENPTKEQLLFGASLALLLSFKTIGEVMYCKISDVKSTSTTGLVNVKKYSLIKLNQISEIAQKALKEAKKV